MTIFQWSDPNKKSVLVTRSDGSISTVSADPTNADYQTIVASGSQILPCDTGWVSSIVKSECSRRIFAVASQNTQSNMGLYISSGAAPDSDKTLAVKWLQWVAAMRAACQSLIAASDLTFAQDNHWPSCPADVAAFTARF